MAHPPQCERCTVEGNEIVRCPRPIDGRDGGLFCTEHAAAIHWSQMREAVADGDDAAAEEEFIILERLGVCPCGRMAVTGTPNVGQCLACSIETEIAWARLRQFECEHGPWYKNLDAYELAFPRRVVAA